MKQHALFPEAPNPSDVVYTPHYVAQDIIQRLNPSGLCLDPCKGDGAFYNHLPGKPEYCELEENLDFFAYKKKLIGLSETHRTQFLKSFYSTLLISPTMLLF